MIEAVGVVYCVLVISFRPSEERNRVSTQSDEDVGQELAAIFGVLEQFKRDNGNLPADDNQSVALALKGKNKLNENYIKGWGIDDYKGVLMDINNKPIEFHFKNDNEVIIYATGTKQRLYGNIATGKSYGTQE